jgi:hypothetical protein
MCEKGPEPDIEPRRVNVAAVPGTDIALVIGSSPIGVQRRRAGLLAGRLGLGRSPTP